MVGGIVGGLAVFVFCLSQLPGAPSSYTEMFGNATSPPAQNLSHDSSDNRVDYDLFDNPKAHPIITADDIIPMKLTKVYSAWVTPTDGGLIMNAQLWIYGGGSHNPIYNVSVPIKDFKFIKARAFQIIKTVSLESGRKVFITLEAHELDTKQTFGPYDLP